MPGRGPDPGDRAPLPDAPSVGFLRPFAGGRANVEIGEYTYFDSPEDPSRFFDENVLYHFDFIGDRLLIGRFCAIALGVRFVMNGATHAMTGFSTYPFNVFGNGWENGFDPQTWVDSRKGDTTVGHDVWIGRDAKIMPGVTIGSGAIIGTGAVVTKDVPAYAIAAGNQAKVIRHRFDDTTIAALLDIAWWYWDAEKITRNLNAIRGANIEDLKAAT